jgi:hypothetical protein
MARPTQTDTAVRLSRPAFIRARTTESSESEQATRRGAGSEPSAHPQGFTYVDVVPGAEQISEVLDSCALFDNICSTSDRCAFALMCSP